jgi:hypothetical protein
VVAMIAVCLPLFYYMIDVPRTRILFPLMTLTVVVVQVNISLRTLMLASHSIAREMEVGNWDSLVLTGINSRLIVMGKWWAILRCVWKDYLFLALLKELLSYGVFQLISGMDMGRCYQWLIGGLCFSHNVYGNTGWMQLNLKTYLFEQFPIFAAFALVEAGFLGALGLFMTLLSGERRVVGFGWAVIIRFILTAVIVVGFLLAGFKGNQLWIQQYNNPLAVSDIRWGMAYWERLNAAGLIQLTLATFIDGGTILFAKPMRYPNQLDIMFQIQSIMALTFCASVMFTHQCLRFAQRLAERHRALPPSPNQNN